MPSGIARSVSSGALRIVQLKKAIEVYTERAQHDRDYCLFVVEQLNEEVKRLEKELHEIHDEIRWDNYKRVL